MTVLYLTNHLNIGGITSYVFSLARGLKQRGHRVYVASSGGELLGQFTQEGIIHIQIPIKTKSEASPKIWLSLFRLRKYIKAEKIDIIHANTRVTQVLAFLIWRFFRKPYVSTCHGFFKRRIFRRIFPLWGKKVIAISEAVRQHLMVDFSVPERDISLIHNGIDIKRFKVLTEAEKRERKKELGLGEGIVIGIIARLSDVKGHVYLLGAMPSVLARFADAQLMIVGEGKIKQELVDLSDKLGISKNILFFTSVRDTSGILCAMDIFVMPSLKEGLGLSLIEAMGCGLAVIGSRVGGIPALIRNGENGLLVNPKDTRDLARAISKLIENQQLRQDIGSNARAFIEQNFLEEDMLRKTERVYENV